MNGGWEGVDLKIPKGIGCGAICVFCILGNMVKGVLLVRLG